MTTDVEKWRDVPGFEGLYEVSDQGRVRSLSRYYQKRNRWGQVAPVFTQGRVLKLGPHPGGYLLVHLYREGKRTAMTLHKVVLLAFVGPRPKGMEALHANGDPTDCRLANLSYGTKEENESDKVRHGTLKFGEASHRSKLSEADVRRVRRMNGASQEFIAAMFGCSPSNISAIQLRKSWRHLR